MSGAVCPPRGGPVIGPWGKTSFAEMRRRVDPSIPIRRYPVEATRDGEVIFTWTPNPHGNRNPVAEVWLMREETR